MTSVLEKLESQSEGLKAQNRAAFRKLAVDVHAGKDVKPEVAEELMRKAGKGWPDLRAAVAELENLHQLRLLAAKSSQLQAESKRLAVVVGTEREKLVELLKAHKLAENDQSKTIRDAEAAHQLAHGEASRAAAAEVQLIKLAATGSPDLHQDYQDARIKAHAARQRKTTVESKLKDLPDSIASLKYRIGSNVGNADNLETKLEQLEGELPRVRKELDALVKEIPKLEAAEVEARKALLTAMIS